MSMKKTFPGGVVPSACVWTGSTSENVFERDLVSGDRGPVERDVPCAVEDDVEVRARRDVGRRRGDDR